MSGQEMALADRLPEWEDPQVQTVYKMLCDPDLCGWTNREEHWEGWVSRNIVRALRCPAPTEPDIRAAARTILQFTYDGNGGNEARKALDTLLAALSSGEPDTNLQKMQIAPEGVTGEAEAQIDAIQALAGTEAADLDFVIHQLEKREVLWRDTIKSFRRQIIIAAIDASPQPAARIGREEYPFLATLSTTLGAMKSAHARGGRRVMAIWLEDIQAIEAAILSLTASAPAGGWQDIATAPKDGTQILVWPYWSDRAPTQVYWRDLQRKPGRWEITPAHFCVRANPTHWQPLPMAPTDTARDAGSDVSRANR